MQLLAAYASSMTERRLHNAEVVKILRNLSSEKQTWYDRKKENKSFNPCSMFIFASKTDGISCILARTKADQKINRKVEELDIFFFFKCSIGYLNLVFGVFLIRNTSHHCKFKMHSRVSDFNN